jgi:hypothetical protein
MTCCCFYEFRPWLFVVIKVDLEQLNDVQARLAQLVER